MQFLVLLAAAALVLPTAAQAQPGTQALPRTCTELVKTIGLIDITADSTIEDRPDGCVLTNVFAGTSSFNRFRLGEVRLIAPDLFAELGAERLPSALELTISGFQVAPETGSALNNYIIEMQSDPLDIHFAYVWNKAAQTLELTDFSVTSPHYGAYRVSARAADILLDPSQLGDLENLPGVLNDVHIELDNARFFSAMLAPSLLNLLPPGEDPRPLIDTYKAAVTAFITALPDASAAPDTKAALISFVSAFPKATGYYTLTLHADPGLKFTALVVDSPSQLAALLTSLQVTATHTPLKQP